jgi:hypothetical protein
VYIYTHNGRMWLYTSRVERQTDTYLETQEPTAHQTSYTQDTHTQIWYATHNTKQIHYTLSTHRSLSVSLSSPRRYCERIEVLPVLWGGGGRVRRERGGCGMYVIREVSACVFIYFYHCQTPRWVACSIHAAEENSNPPPIPH